jgi:hypothetical protein
MAAGSLPLTPSCARGGTPMRGGRLSRAGTAGPAGRLRLAGTASRPGKREQPHPAGEGTLAGMAGRATSQDLPPGPDGTARHQATSGTGTIAGARDIQTGAQPDTGRGRPPGTLVTVLVTRDAESGSGRAAHPRLRRSARAREWRAWRARTPMRPSTYQDQASLATPRDPAYLLAARG